MTRFGDEDMLSARRTPRAAMRPLTGGWQRAFPMYSPTQLFALVSDIEQYPQFVPGCIKARIIEKTDGSWRVDNVFRFGPMRSRFLTRAEFDPPWRVEITSSDGLWTSFQLVWCFEQATQGCRVTCRFSVEFRSRLLAALASFGLAEAERQIIKAFEMRARTLYGSPTTNA